MNKSKNCADKAASILKINCKKKTNRLVFNEHQKVKCGQPIYVPKISRTCGTRIRYCTAKEIKLMTSSQLCDLPKSRSPFTAGGFLVDLLRNAAKAAIVLGAAYATYGLGFWGPPEHTQATFAELCEAMPCHPDPPQRYESKSLECEQTLDILSAPPYDPCKCDDPIPIDMEKCLHKMKQVWNHAIIFVFGGLIDGPGQLADFFASKLKELPSTESDPGTKTVESEKSEYNSGTRCEQMYDYRGKYCEEEQYESKEVQEQIEALLKAEELRETECNSPPCDF